MPHQNSSSLEPWSPVMAVTAVIGQRTGPPSITKVWLVLDEYNLLENNLSEFINALCSLVDEQKDDLPAIDWEVLEATLRLIMIQNQWGGLYHYLIENYGPESLNFPAWWHFTNETDWQVVMQAFIDMPTKMLEEYAGAPWDRRRTHRDDVPILMEALTKRSDHWGVEGWPAEILFDLQNR